MGNTGIQRGEHGDHHEQQHPRAHGAHQRQPQLLPGDDAPQEEQRHKNGDQQHLAHKAQDYIANVKAHPVKGQTGDRAAQQGADEERQDHQRTADKAHQCLGNDVFALVSAGGEQVLGITAAEILRHEEAHQHRNDEIQQVDVAHSGHVHGHRHARTADAADDLPDVVEALDHRLHTGLRVHGDGAVHHGGHHQDQNGHHQAGANHDV